MYFHIIHPNADSLIYSTDPKLPDMAVVGAWTLLRSAYTRSVSGLPHALQWRIDMGMV